MCLRLDPVPDVVSAADLDLVVGLDFDLDLDVDENGG